MNKFMEEKATLRNEAMEMILPRFNSAFTEALKVPTTTNGIFPLIWEKASPVLSRLL